MTYRRCALRRCSRGNPSPGRVETRDHGWPRCDEASAENAHWNHCKVYQRPNGPDVAGVYIHTSGGLHGRSRRRGDTCASKGRW